MTNSSISRSLYPCSWLPSCWDAGPKIGQLEHAKAHRLPNICKSAYGMCTYMHKHLCTSRQSIEIDTERENAITLLERTNTG